MNPALSNNISMETINILCATDKNFVPYCGIMLTSLFYNNEDEHIEVYLLVDDTVKEQDKSKYDQNSNNSVKKN